ncbi:E3 ubiquitin-protein ligase lubel-like [Neocloeon triangulifer]|uniref:E3 ubiquitin-protein ligase lubel-like n=1 Tax=Neocloeon triangulifer TaxID=2078957 RepID=UPI00286FA5F6|nr:E3 ubiquitin-protein ligase lubel-like [Neocloeon triangulifer]
MEDDRQTIYLIDCCCGEELELKPKMKHYVSKKSGGTSEVVHCKFVNGGEEKSFKKKFILAGKCPFCNKLLAALSLYKHVFNHCHGDINKRTGSPSTITIKVEIHDRATRHVAAALQPPAVLVDQSADESDESSSDESSSDESSSEESSSEESSSEESSFDESSSDSSKSSSSTLEVPPEKKIRLTKQESCGKENKSPTLKAVLMSMGFSDEEASLASHHCTCVDKALNFLENTCPLCFETVSADKMVAMLRCQHSCCVACATAFFTTEIREKATTKICCMLCNEPEDLRKTWCEDEILDYMTQANMLLKTLLPVEVFKIYEAKVRDEALTKDKDFVWCVEAKCGAGYFDVTGRKKTTCPHCGSITCKLCRQIWSDSHSKIQCEKSKGDEILSYHGSNLEEIVQCPSCNSRFSLSRGGCMHMQCTYCKHEFCSGCSEPFLIGDVCQFGPSCHLLGLHSHHHRNCMFFMRDKAPEDLQRLLQEEMVDFEKGDPETTEGGRRCKVIGIQRDSPSGLVDATCDEEVVSGYAGFCKAHYTEYLCGVIKQNDVDPSTILTVQELKATLVRFGKDVPPKSPELNEDEYQTALIEAVCTLPLKPVPMEKSASGSSM